MMKMATLAGIGMNISGGTRAAVPPQSSSSFILHRSHSYSLQTHRRNTFISISQNVPKQSRTRKCFSSISASSDQQQVRVRFAPSPTGNLHVGGARTALFNYLFARSKGGKFILRIEDTDLERSTKESEEAVLRDLSWLGLTWDEGPGAGGEYGPYRQSERNDLYKQYANKLLNSGQVYRCFCSNQELEQMKEIAKEKQLPPVYTGKWATATEEEVQEELAKGTPFTYRFRVPKEGSLKINDLIRGEVSWNLDTLGDFVVMRSNGQPVYNFCVTVDDATMAITHVISDSMNSYFDGYINASTTLNQFEKMYEKALESRNEKEVKADYDTMNTLPLLRTPSPMEKQASQLYTRKIFMRFQEELVETLTLMASKTEAEDDDGDVTTTTYQVAKFGEENKSYRVNFNVLEMKASCSCCMFKFSGLLCRHVLAVFRVTNVLTLPSSYILKRWTINAKSSVILEEHALCSSYLESHTVRYNTLKHEALKFVEEGADSVDTYNVAMIALEEAARRVSIAAKNEGTINGRNSREGLRSNGTLTKSNTRNHHGDVDHNLSEDEMDRKIQELNNELDCVRRKCEVYRANLLSVLKDIEDHKQQLALKVQIIRYSMKDCL